MNTAEFHVYANKLILDVEKQIDYYVEIEDQNIDYETHGNVLTITFENNSKIIINKQEPLHQVWLATRKQGYHFDYIDGVWICSRNKGTFNDIFKQAMEDQM